MISSSVRSYFSFTILHTCLKILVCRVGIRNQCLDGVDQVFVFRAAVQGFIAVVHRAVGDGAEYGLALLDGQCEVVLKLLCRDISDTRDLCAAVPDGLYDALSSVFIHTGEGQLVLVGEVVRKRRL